MFQGKITISIENTLHLCYFLLTGGKCIIWKLTGWSTCKCTAGKSFPCDREKRYFLTILLLVRREYIHPSHWWVDTKPSAERRWQFNCGTCKMASFPSVFSTCFSLLLAECLEQPLLTRTYSRWESWEWTDWCEEASWSCSSPKGDLLGCPWGFAWNRNMNTWMSPWASKNESASKFLYCPQFCTAV